VVEGDETVVGDGDPMSVAGEIAQYMMGSAEGRFGVDDPVQTEEGTQEGAEGSFILQRLERAGEGKLALLQSSF